MKQSSWCCTFFIQVSLCLVVYVSLHLGHPFFFSNNDSDDAGVLDLHFISVAGGFRPLHRQTRLLRLMEKVAETFNAKFVVSTSEHGEEDPLLQNVISRNFILDFGLICPASFECSSSTKKVVISFVHQVVVIFSQATRVSSPLKLPWYTAKEGSGYFRERIEMPFGGFLDVVFLGSLHQEVLGGPSNGSTISQLKGLTRILKAADGDWRIVVGSDPYALVTYTLTKEPDEAKEIASTFHQIMTKYGVNLHISEKDCTSGASYKGFTCITVPNQSENRCSMNDSKREVEDGFLLHRVSISEFVTYTIDSSGQVVNTRLVKQRGKETI